MFHKTRPTVLKALPVFLVRTNREPETLKFNFHFIRIFAAFLQYLMCVKEDFRNHCTPDNKQKLRASSCPSSWLIVENSANSQLKRALWWLWMEHANKSSAAAIMVFKNRGALSRLLLLWGCVLHRSFSQESRRVMEILLSTAGWLVDSDYEWNMCGRWWRITSHCVELSGNKTISPNTGHELISPCSNWIPLTNASSHKKRPLTLSVTLWVCI